MNEEMQHLDPERGHPGYWDRFHARTTRLAAPELARRRRNPGMTVSGVVSSWSRTLVPLTMAAAAAALAVLYGDTRRTAPLDTSPVGVERVVEELDGTAPPSILGGSSDTDIGTVAADGF